MSLFGEIKFFVELQVTQMKHSICITQSKYVKEILKTFRTEDSKLVSTPKVTSHKLSKNVDSTEVNQTLYISMIGKLQYVIHSRPDIALIVGITRYLKGTKKYSLYYKKNENFILKAYIDVDWASSLDARKCTSGGAFFL